MPIFKTPNYDFVRWRWHALALSLVMILAGVYVMATRGLQYGVEFSGGTIVILEFDQVPDLQRVRTALEAMPGGAGHNAVVQQYGDRDERKIMIRLAQAGDETAGN